ncbi:hypothetical protein F5B20DRAFT_554149 [Whalleya microplaca]|nr:hypothetical protein F5B20DRAFT_554149 [Whalleya microplaca]
MSHPAPHPLALFSLRPLNEQARDVVKHPFNKHFVSRYENTYALDIGHAQPISGSNATLATLGRNGDILLEGRSISKIQCSFEIDYETNIVMFFDRSHSQTCQVFGPNARPFEFGRPRKVVVSREINTVIGIGGIGRDLIQFRLHWHGAGDTETVERVEKRKNAILEENPRFARTVDVTDTALPTGMVTRIHEPGPRQPKIRAERVGDPLGVGSFGKVYAGFNVDTGQLMAIKVV